MRISKSSIALLIAGVTSACGSGGDSNDAAAANATDFQNGSRGEEVSTALTPTVPQSQQSTTIRAVKVGVDGEHGMDACHTSGQISGQDTVSVMGAPEEEAASTDGLEPGMTVDICETLPGWYGIVYRQPADPDMDCGTGENLPGPRNYSGDCRSGWVPENNVELTAG